MWRIHCNADNSVDSLVIARRFLVSREPSHFNTSPLHEEDDTSSAEEGNQWWCRYAVASPAKVHPPKMPTMETFLSPVTPIQRDPIYITSQTSPTGIMEGPCQVEASKSVTEKTIKKGRNPLTTSHNDNTPANPRRTPRHVREKVQHRSQPKLVGYQRASKNQTNSQEKVTRSSLTIPSRSSRRHGNPVNAADQPIDFPDFQDSFVFSSDTAAKNTPCDSTFSLSHSGSDFSQDITLYSDDHCSSGISTDTPLASPAPSYRRSSLVRRRSNIRASNRQRGFQRNRLSSNDLGIDAPPVLPRRTKSTRATTKRPPTPPNDPSRMLLASTNTQQPELPANSPAPTTRYELNRRQSLNVDLLAEMKMSVAERRRRRHTNVEQQLK